MFHPNQLRTGEVILFAEPTRLAPASLQAAPARTRGSSPFRQRRVLRRHRPPVRRDRRSRHRPGARLGHPHRRRSLNLMSVHPARIVASLSLLTGRFFVGVSVLAIGFAESPRERRDDHPPVGRGAARGPHRRPAVHRRFAGLERRRRRAVCRRKVRPDGRPRHRHRSRHRRATRAHPHRRRSRSVRLDASARSTNDGIGIIGAFTSLYLLIIVAVAVARLPGNISTGVTA